MIRDKNNMSYKDFLMLQETERSRIAEDLHDTTVQELVALSQKLDLANLYFDYSGSVIWRLQVTSEEFCIWRNRTSDERCSCIC